MNEEERKTVRTDTCKFIQLSGRYVGSYSFSQCWAIYPLLFPSYTPLISHVPVRSVISLMISYIVPAILSGICSGSVSPFPKLPSPQDRSNRNLPNPFRLKNFKVKACTWQSEHFAMLSPLSFSSSSQEKHP